MAPKAPVLPSSSASPVGPHPRDGVVVAGPVRTMWLGEARVTSSTAGGEGRSASGLEGHELLPGAQGGEGHGSPPARGVEQSQGLLAFWPQHPGTHTPPWSSQTSKAPSAVPSVLGLETSGGPSRDRPLGAGPRSPCSAVERCPWHQAHDGEDEDKDQDPALRGEAPGQPASDDGRHDEAKCHSWGPEGPRQCQRARCPPS